MRKQPYIELYMADINVPWYAIDFYLPQMAQQSHSNETEKK